jgi:hypothetical protein
MNVDWLNDDGVNLPMINDVVRNVFYDKILSSSVKGKKCCEVGFGTGLLSLLALKHGATRIIAYEKDPGRFELGQEIIKQLKLTDRIELRNELANTENIETTGCDVVFHEIIHQALWAEGLWLIKPLRSGMEYVPGTYFFEMYATEISDTTVDGFQNGDETLEYFNPGIDIDTNFINLINNFITHNDSKKLKPIIDDDQLILPDWNKIHKDWSWNPGHVFRSYPKQLLCKYTVDYNARKMTFVDSNGTREADLDSNSLCQMMIDTSAWRNLNLMLEPRFGLQHNHERLYIDDCRNWGAEIPRIFIKPTSNLLFTQNFDGTNGTFRLSKI